MHPVTYPSFAMPVTLFLPRRAGPRTAANVPGTARTLFMYALGLAFCAAVSFLQAWGTAQAGPSIVDDAGKNVTLSAPAGRIVPLYAGMSEIIIALGKKDAIAARTASDESAPQALPEVGTHMRPNFELVASLAPDLAVILEGRKEAAMTADALSRLGIAVARFRIHSFEDLFSCIRRLGVLLGAEHEADAEIARMRRELEVLAAQSAAQSRRPTIFFEIRYPNLLGAGGGNMLTDIARAAGGENCLAGHQDRMVRLSEEALAALEPDIYIVLEGPMNKAPAPLGERPHYRHLGAVRKNRAFTLPEQTFSRPGPRSLEAAKELRAIITDWLREQ